MEKPSNNSESITVDASKVPDLPCPFGYKIWWYVIKDETTHSVVEKLRLKIIRESNWNAGIDWVYNYRDYMFVSPKIGDYVLVVNIYPDDTNETVKKHALLFQSFQYFGTHRVVEYHAWAKFEGGNVIRGYSYLGERGEITWCEGSITDEELSLSFDRFPSSSDEMLSDDFDCENLPCEEDVLAIAKAWGVDTQFEGGAYEKGTGFICKQVER